MRGLHSTLTRLRVAIVPLLALALTACAASPRVLHFGVEDAPEGKRILWPGPPEVPRFMYAGQLLGEANFKRTKEPKARGFLHWLAGLVVGEAPPVVMQRPQSGVVDPAGRVIVSDASRQALFVFDAEAGALIVWDKAEGLANFVMPVGVAVGADGEIFVADAELGVVARLDSKGNPRPAIGRGLLKRPTGIAYDPVRKELFVADTYTHDIKVFDSAGRLVRTLGRHGEAPGEFNFPTHLAFARGELYVTDTMNSRIQVFADGGEKLRLTFGARGLFVGNLVRPKGVTVDSDGNIYVVESYYDHLLVYNRDGAFLMAIGGVGRDTGRFYLPAGAWADSRNRIYVADMFNGRVVVFQYLETGGDG